MTRKMSLPACLLCCFVVSMMGCSFMHTSKPAKVPETDRQAQASTIEWGERKWELYQKDNGGVSYYLDKGAISFPSRNMIHLWRKRVFPGKEQMAGHIGSSHKEIIAFDEFDCRNDQYRSLELQAVNWDGTATEIFRRPSPWGPAYQGTADEYIMDNYCGEAKKAQ